MQSRGDTVELSRMRAEAPSKRVCALVSRTSCSTEKKKKAKLNLWALTTTPRQHKKLTLERMQEWALKNHSCVQVRTCSWRKLRKPCSLSCGPVRTLEGGTIQKPCMPWNVSLHAPEKGAAKFLPELSQSAIEGSWIPEKNCWERDDWFRLAWQGPLRHTCCGSPKRRHRTTTLTISGTLNFLFFFPGWNSSFLLALRNRLTLAT